MYIKHFSVYKNYYSNRSKFRRNIFGTAFTTKRIDDVFCWYVYRANFENFIFLPNSPLIQLEFILMPQCQMQTF